MTIDPAAPVPLDLRQVFTPQPLNAANPEAIVLFYDDSAGPTIPLMFTKTVNGSWQDTNGRMFSGSTLLKHPFPHRVYLVAPGRRVPMIESCLSVDPTGLYSCECRTGHKHPMHHHGVVVWAEGVD